MKRMIRALRSIKGASILEVLIALAIMGVITTAVLRAYVVQHKNYIAQDDISTIQQSARASIDELTRQLRMAGHEVPNTLDAIEAYDTNPDTIVLNFLATGCDTYLAAPMPATSSPLECGTSPSCFYDGQWAYIVEPDSGVGEWFEISAVQNGTNSLEHASSVLSRRYGANSLVLGLTRAKFFIDNTTDPNHPKLMIEYMGKSPQIYAEDITDLQFQYRMKSGALMDTPGLVENVRQVLVSITGRSKNPDPEDTNSPYQFRTYNSGVYTRNIDH